MVKEADVEEAGGFFDFAGEIFVGTTGAQLAGGVVMAKHQAGGIFISAFLRIRRGSATVAVMPPSLMISKCLILLAWFRKITAKTSWA